MEWNGTHLVRWKACELLSIEKMSPSWIFYAIYMIKHEILIINICFRELKQGIFMIDFWSAANFDEFAIIKSSDLMGSDIFGIVVLLIVYYCLVYRSLKASAITDA